MICFSERPLRVHPLGGPGMVPRVLELHRLLAAILIAGSGGVLEQVLQVFATGLYRHKLQI